MQRCSIDITDVIICCLLALYSTVPLIVAVWLFGLTYSGLSNQASSQAFPLDPDDLSDLQRL